MAADALTSLLAIAALLIGKYTGFTRAGALIGICSAVGALGGVGINLALRQSYLSSGTETSAYWLFLASYVVAAILTWTMYVRRPVCAPSVPRPALEAEPARV